MVQRKTAVDHCRGVQSKSGEQQQVVEPIILTKPLPPKKYRINHTQPVNSHCEQEKVSIGKPSHDGKLVSLNFDASGIISTHAAFQKKWLSPGRSNCSRLPAARNFSIACCWSILIAGKV